MEKWNDNHSFDIKTVINLICIAYIESFTVIFFLSLRCFVPSILLLGEKWVWSEILAKWLIYIEFRSASSILEWKIHYTFQLEVYK